MNFGFANYHPLLSLSFFISALVFGMIFVHPLYITVSLVMATLYYFLLKGKKGISLFASLFCLFIIVSLLNPLFNQSGNYILFTYFKNRSFTLEGLLYGISTAGMFLSVILWLACYNVIVTEDKFVYMFGRFLPSGSLILTMTFRLVPLFKYKVSSIATARKCIGKGTNSTKLGPRLKNSTDILSVLTTASLENSVITADSMKSRGYSTVKRSSFALYHFSFVQILVLSLILILNVLTILFSVMGATFTEYLPVIKISFDNFTCLGATLYALLLSIPSVLHISEDVKCHILKSKI